MLRMRWLVIAGLVGACGDNVPAAIDAPVVPRDMAVPIDAPADATLTAQLRVSPATATFGPTSSNGLSAPITFVVTNDGDAPSGVIAKQITGPDASSFMIATDACTTSLAPLASCTLELTFRSTFGSYAATLAVSATPGGAVAAALSATALGEQFLTAAPSWHDYGLVVVGQSSTQTFSIFNAGGLPATLSIQIAGPDATQFVIAGADTCTGATLAAGTSCSITIAFSPTTAGMKTATLTASQPAGAAVSVGLQGVLLPPRSLTASPSPYDYGDVIVGQSSSQTFTITNPGGSPLTLLSVQLTGPDPTHFLLGTETCTGAPVAPGASCTIAVAFSPTSIGLKVASVSVASASGTTSISVSGDGTP